MDTNSSPETERAICGGEDGTWRENGGPESTNPEVEGRNRGKEGKKAALSHMATGSAFRWMSPGY